MSARRLPNIVSGATIHGRYELERELGKGAMGTVWRARHLALQSSVAVKFIDETLTKHPDFVGRFEREARAAAQINSPNVVKVMDYGLDDAGHPFIVMEFLEGTTLDDYLRDNDRLDLTATARIVSDTCRGLSSAHAAGIVHRDVKPENLFLCDDGDQGWVTKLLDFGVAKAIYNQNSAATAVGQLVGSPAFMSPEQARGNSEVDFRSDLFSVGILAYVCLTGQNPFAASNVYNVLMAICSTDPEPVSTAVRGLPESLNLWFARALAKKKEHRFQSAREMAREFRRAAGVPTSAMEGVTFSRARPVPSSGSDATRVDSVSTVATTSAGSRTVHSVGHASRPATPAPTETHVTTRSVDPGELEGALGFIRRVPHVAGVALVGPGDECLMKEGDGDAAHYTLVAQRARLVGETLESLDGAGVPALFTCHFGKGAAYVRWFGRLALVVLGDARLRSLLLTVGSSRLGTQIEAFTRYCGSETAAATALRATPERRSKEDPTRTAGPGPVSDGPPSVGSFGASSAGREALDTGARGTPLPASPRPAVNVPGAPRRRPPGAGGGPTSSGERVRLYRGRSMGPSPEPSTPVKKNVRVYRGRAVEEPTSDADASQVPTPTPADPTNPAAPWGTAPVVPRPGLDDGASGRRLGELLASTSAVASIFLMDSEGVPLGQPTETDLDVTAAIAIVAHAQVTDLGEVLDAGQTHRWLVASSGTNLYIWSRTDGSGEERVIVASGPPNDHPAKVAEHLEKQL